MLVDSHCHLDRLDLARFEGGLAGVLDAAAAHGVTRLLSVATDLESWPALVRLTEPYPRIALSVGVHPSEDGGRSPTVAELVALGREPHGGPRVPAPKSPGSAGHPALGPAPGRYVVEPSR